MTQQYENDTMALTQQDLMVLLDHAPDAIGRFDRNLRHTYVNQATADANRLSIHDFYGKSMQDLGHTPEISDLINSNLREVFRTGQERTLELLFELGPTSTWYQCRMAPEFVDGRVESVLVISRDISSQRRAERASREAEKRLAVAEVSSSLAHGIHNPLASVYNLLYLLDKNDSLDQQAKEMVILASQEMDRVAKICKQLLVLEQQEPAAR